MHFGKIVTNAIFCGFALLAIFAAPVGAQSGSVDPTFSAVPSNLISADTNFQQVIQPDGKIIVYNAPNMFVDGVLRSGMFRLNLDGSIDTTFSYNNEGGVGIRNLMIAPDGKIVVAGTASPNHAKMIRLNSDGSLDNSFAVFITAVGPPEFTSNWLVVNAIQSDGKVIATHGSWGNIGGTWYSYSMRRYNLDGTVDPSFNSPLLDGGHIVTTTSVIELLPDDSFYLAVTSRSHLGGSLKITRRLANGADDLDYAGYSTTFSGSFLLSITDISLALDGGVLATGVFEPTGLGFPPRQQIRKFASNGSPVAFNAPLVFSGGAVHQLPDGKVLYSASGGAATRPLLRLEADGSVDDKFTLDPVITAIKNSWQVDPMNRPVFLATTTAGNRLVRLLENGGIDPAFNPVLGTVGTTSLVALQPDGKVLVAGNFTFMNGIPRNRFARLNADGSTDASFDPGTGFNETPRQMLVQPDGKILAVGTFSSYNGTAVSPVVRLNSDGSIDKTFTVSVSGSSLVEGLALHPDGKILIGGSFTAVNSVNRTGIARLESTGALDMTFNPILGSPLAIKKFYVESNGRIVIGGQFTGVNGVDRTNFARVESNGTTDSSFQANGLSIVHGLWRQPDGKYLITHGPAAFLERRNNDGSADMSFTAPTLTSGSGSGIVLDLLLQPDGSMVIVGSFNTVNGTLRLNLTRLSRNGTHIPTFLNIGANAAIFSAVPYSVGKIIVSGSFTSIDNVTRLGVARVNVPALQSRTLFDFNGDGRADFTVYRPSSGVWYQLYSGGGPYGSPVFGLPGDIPVPADFDGDGITDEAIFRPSDGRWWYQSSINNSHLTRQYGMAGDLPMPGDFDGDGKADFIVYRPSNGTWYRSGSQVGETPPYNFGQAGDIPVIGDFDGDGKVDPAIFRPSNGNWWYAASSAGGQHRAVHWGQTGDIPVPADYDGDGKTDYAVFRPSNGGWYVTRSSDQTYAIMQFGLDGDRPVSADYDGDGKADIAVFRPSTGVWYVYQTTGGITILRWGISTDIPAPGAFLP